MELINTVYIGIGSNLGERTNFIEKAKLELEKIGRILSVSPIYESHPFGYASSSAYLNLVVEFITDLEPKKLLEKNQNIEAKLLRKKSKDHYEDRTLDLDILFFNEEIIEEDDLVVPHLGIVERRFVLIPLMDICPNKKHPMFAQTIAQLYKKLKDKNDLRLFAE